MQIGTVVVRSGLQAYRRSAMKTVIALVLRIPIFSEDFLTPVDSKEP